MPHRRFDPKSLIVLALGLSVLGARAQPDEAAELIAQGRTVFLTRCVVCHGANADGKSDLARVMKPPPANLRASLLSSKARNRIVRKGGASVGRSPNMPVWEQELDESQLRAVIAYVGSLSAANAAETSAVPTGSAP